LDARLIRADALIVRSGADFWSRPEDVATLHDHLSCRRSGRVTVVVIPEATHYVHLDRPEHGRQMFLDAVLEFLTGNAQ
jgi:pimeloyl-ACP methyl ester carboxylesterase